jgi:uncharacterized membrane protein YqgA involved in biofilm formation
VGERKLLLGTIVNASVIIIGAILGNFLKSGFPERFKATLMQAISLAVILIGLSMALKTQNAMVVTLSIVIGGVIGELLRIEDWLNSLGLKLEQRFGNDNGNGNFAKAFVSASLVYCVGAMAIMGSLESGLTGNYNTLFIKSILDGVSSIVFASSMGIGVAFSALPVFLYQGGITLAAGYIKPLLTDAIVREMTATGGLLIFGIGINILTGGKVQIKVGNLLPALLVAVFMVVVFTHFHLM